MGDPHHRTGEKGESDRDPLPPRHKPDRPYTQSEIVQNNVSAVTHAPHTNPRFGVGRL